MHSFSSLRLLTTVAIRTNQDVVYTKTKLKLSILPSSLTRLHIDCPHSSSYFLDMALEVNGKPNRYYQRILDVGSALRDRSLLSETFWTPIAVLFPRLKSLCIIGNAQLSSGDLAHSTEWKTVEQVVHSFLKLLPESLETFCWDYPPSLNQSNINGLPPRLTFLSTYILHADSGQVILPPNLTCLELCETSLPFANPLPPNFTTLFSNRLDPNYFKYLPRTLKKLVVAHRSLPNPTKENFDELPPKLNHLSFPMGVHAMPLPSSVTELSICRSAPSNIFPTGIPTQLVALRLQALPSVPAEEIADLLPKSLKFLSVTTTISDKEYHHLKHIMDIDQVRVNGVLLTGFLFTLDPKKPPLEISWKTLKRSWDDYIVSEAQPRLLDTNIRYNSCLLTFPDTTTSINGLEIALTVAASSFKTLTHLTTLESVLLRHQNAITSSDRLVEVLTPTLTRLSSKQEDWDVELLEKLPPSLKILELSVLNVDVEVVFDQGDYTPEFYKFLEEDKRQDFNYPKDVHSFLRMQYKKPFDCRVERFNIPSLPVIITHFPRHITRLKMLKHRYFPNIDMQVAFPEGLKSLTVRPRVLFGTKCLIPKLPESLTDLKLGVPAQHLDPFAGTLPEGLLHLSLWDPLEFQPGGYGCLPRGLLSLMVFGSHDACDADWNDLPPNLVRLKWCLADKVIRFPSQ